MKNKILAFMIGMSFFLIGTQGVSAEINHPSSKIKHNLSKINKIKLNKLKATLNISIENCSVENRLSCSWLWQQLNAAIDHAISVCEPDNYDDPACISALDDANTLGAAYILLCGTGPPPEAPGESRNRTQHKLKKRFPSTKSRIDSVERKVGLG